MLGNAADRIDTFGLEHKVTKAVTDALKKKQLVGGEYNQCRGGTIVWGVTPERTD